MDLETKLLEVCDLLKHYGRQAQHDAAREIVGMLCAAAELSEHPDALVVVLKAARSRAERAEFSEPARLIGLIESNRRLTGGR